MAKCDDCGKRVKSNEIHHIETNEVEDGEYKYIDVCDRCFEDYRFCIVCKKYAYKTAVTFYMSGFMCHECDPF